MLESEVMVVEDIMDSEDVEYSVYSEDVTDLVDKLDIEVVMVFWVVGNIADTMAAGNIRDTSLAAGNREL